MTDYIKLFPEYEDVFYDEIALHRKYFLPLASINLRYLHPDRDEWLHFVSVKEIYNERVGEHTGAYHTKYTRLDALAFDIIDGKYKFDADWRYFGEHRFIPPNEYHIAYTDQEIGYNMNEVMYQLKKSYYQKYAQLYEGDFKRPALKAEDVRRLMRLRALKPEDLRADEISSYLVESHQQKIAGVFVGLAPFAFPDVDSILIPRNDGKVFELIGIMEGSDFQHTAPGDISLFHSPELKKAVVGLGYLHLRQISKLP